MATLEHSLAISYKVNILLPYKPAIMLLDMYPHDMRAYVYMDGYRGFIHKCQHL